MYMLRQKLSVALRLGLLCATWLSVRRPWPSGCSHTPYDPGCPCVAGGYRVISSSYEWSGQERARRELPARRGRVRQNGRAGGGLLRRFGPNSSPGQV